MNLLCSADLEANVIEVEISDNYDGWMKLRKAFCDPQEKIEIQSEMIKDDVYPRNLNSLIIKEICDRKTIKVYIDPIGEKLIFEGSKKSLSCIGESIYNFFGNNAYDELHFHLDYFPNDVNSYCLLAPTNCCLVFVYRDRF